MNLLGDSGKLFRNVGRMLLIFSGAKSFENGFPIGSKTLNQMGLHRWRVRRAAGMAALRRKLIGRHLPEVQKEEFARNGYVVVKNVFPEEGFRLLRDQLLSSSWPAREMIQGDTITRRIAVDREMLAAIPALAELLAASWWKRLLRYVSTYNVEPIYYIQTIQRRPTGAADPQTALHADTFHSSMKAWFFLDDVKQGEGAFSYVPGSHRLSPERLAWEHRKALTLPEAGDRLTRRGSFRIEPSELAGLGLPQAIELAVPANTLVVADTVGFHARGPSGPGLNRVEIWAYSRRNPFLPFLGFDLFSLPIFAPRRAEWVWRIRDRFPKMFKQPWKKAGLKKPLDGGFSG